MKNFFKKTFKTLLAGASLAVLLTAFVAHADVTTNFWVKGANGQLYTNSGNGQGNAVINVAGCNGCGGGGGGVTSLNSLTGAVTLSAGSNITLTPTANNIQISSTGGTPASPANSVQYNDAGAFGGDTNFVWNKTTQSLTVTGDTGLQLGTSSDIFGLGPQFAGASYDDGTTMFINGLVQDTGVPQVNLGFTGTVGNAFLTANTTDWWQIDTQDNGTGDKSNFQVRPDQVQFSYQSPSNWNNQFRLNANGWLLGNFSNDYTQAWQQMDFNSGEWFFHGTQGYPVSNYVHTGGGLADISINGLYAGSNNGLMTVTIDSEGDSGVIVATSITGGTPQVGDVVVQDATGAEGTVTYVSGNTIYFNNSNGTDFDDTDCHILLVIFINGPLSVNQQQDSATFTDGTDTYANVPILELPNFPIQGMWPSFGAGMGHTAGDVFEWQNNLTYGNVESYNLLSGSGAIGDVSGVKRGVTLSWTNSDAVIGNVNTFADVDVVSDQVKFGFANGNLLKFNPPTSGPGMAGYVMTDTTGNGDLSLKPISGGVTVMENQVVFGSPSNTGIGSDNFLYDPTANSFIVRDNTDEFLSAALNGGNPYITIGSTTLGNGNWFRIDDNSELMSTNFSLEYKITRGGTARRLFMDGTVDVIGDYDNLSDGVFIKIDHDDSFIQSGDPTGGNTYLDVAGNGFIVNTNSLSFLGNLSLGKTITAAGTTGDQTINKTTLSVNFAALATTLTVTDSLVNMNSIVLCTVAANDSTMKSVAVVQTAGSFQIVSNAAATAETRVNCSVTN